jgi:glutathione S-transferase
MAAQLMLRHKGIEFKRTDLFPVFSKLVLRGLGFPRDTVPAMKIDGRRVQGSREISRELDRIDPLPPLFPGDKRKRKAVEEAERFGDEELQHPVRQVLWWALKRDRAPLRSFSEGYDLGIPTGLALKTAAPIVALSARFNEASDENVRADLARLGGLLRQVDEMIEAGTLDGVELNAADFQIAASIRLAMSLQDLRPLIAARPAGHLAERVQPKLPGDIPPILPPAWLQPLRAESATTPA